MKRVWKIYRSVFYSTVLSDPIFLPVTCFDFPLRRARPYEAKMEIEELHVTSGNDRVSKARLAFLAGATLTLSVCPSDVSDLRKHHELIEE